MATIATAAKPLEVFATCPQSSDTADGSAFLDRVADVARWSERYGCRGILVYTDNRLVDPWLISQVIMQHTEQLAPLVAVQPIYMHPYAVAKMVASLGYLHGRALYLNMVAGGFPNDLQALNDRTPHDRRYARLVEYTTIIRRLLQGQTVTFEGEFHRVSNLTLTPRLAPELMPEVFISGSSEAGFAAARAIGATAIKYPEPATDGVAAESLPEGNSGIRIGLIARDAADEAWRVARARFPEDRKGQLTHQLAMKVSDSSWHQQLSQLAGDDASAHRGYWLVPFQNYKTFCPYLVGSHAEVAGELRRYISLGHHVFILDIPPDEEELHHVNLAFALAKNGTL